MMKFIDREKLIEILDETTKHQFISVETETTPKCNQTGRDTGKTIFSKLNVSPTNIRKISQFVSQIGLDYTNVIANRLKKEEKQLSEYKPGKSWHIPVPGTKNLVQHKDTKELYVYMFLTAN